MADRIICTQPGSWWLWAALQSEWFLSHRHTLSFPRRFRQISERRDIFPAQLLHSINQSRWLASCARCRKSKLRPDFFTWPNFDFFRFWRTQPSGCSRATGRGERRAGEQLIKRASSALRQRAPKGEDPVGRGTARPSLLRCSNRHPPTEAAVTDRPARQPSCSLDIHSKVFFVLSFLNSFSQRYFVTFQSSFIALKIIIVLEK